MDASTRHILFVKAVDLDDEVPVSALLDGLSWPRGAPEIVVVKNGEEALEAAMQRPFELAVAELVLPRPGMSGAETVLRLREEQPELRTILVSDHGALRSLVTEITDAFVPRAEKRWTHAFRNALALAIRQVLGDENFAKGQLHAKTPEGIAAETPPRTEAAKTEAARAENPVSSRHDASSWYGPADAPPDELSPSAAERSSSAAQRNLSGQLLAAKYRLGEEIGRGGMGVVHRAEDTFIRRPVAIKMLRVPQSRAPERVRRRMHREVMIAGRLTHPNLVTVYDAGLEGETMYLVMELVEGRTLNQRIAEDGALPRDDAVGIALQILEALSYAHSKRIVHCDLKPQNVLLRPDGLAKVADFSVATLLTLVHNRGTANTDDTGPPSLVLPEITLDSSTPGTLAYMAPEQVIREPVDPRADLYSCGVLLFEMLLGRPISTLFSSPLARATLDLPPVPGEPRLTQVVDRAMALRRRDRYQSADAFAEALRDATRPPWWKRILGRM